MSSCGKKQSSCETYPLVQAEPPPTAEHFARRLTHIQCFSLPALTHISSVMALLEAMQNKAYTSAI